MYKEIVMSPIKEGTNREKNAINAVVAENGHQVLPETPNNSTKLKKRPNRTSPSGVDSIHAFFNCNTGFPDNISDSQLLQLGREYIKWAREYNIELGVPLKQTFWLDHGISRFNLQTFRKSLPELNELVITGDEYCGETREKIIRKYYHGIWARQAVYVSDYMAHDEHMIEVRERIKHQIDKEEGLTPQQQQTLFYSFMEPFLKDKKPDIDKKNDAGK
jgi:hypothetical protein